MKGDLFIDNHKELIVVNNKIKGIEGSIGRFRM